MNPRIATLTLAAALLSGCLMNSSYAPLDRLAAEVDAVRNTAVPELAPAAWAETEASLEEAQEALGWSGTGELRHLTRLARTRLEIAQAEAEAAAAASERDVLTGVRAEILETARERTLQPVPSGRLSPAPDLTEHEAAAPEGL